MKQVKIKYPFKTIAIVVLPDHIHAIWQLPSNDDNYSLRWQRIKGLFTRKLIAKGEKLNKDKKGEYNVWQRRFWEHTIRDEKDLDNHINYIHYNPIKHGLVTDLRNWMFSSFPSYVKNGLLPPDWSCGEGDNVRDEFGGVKALGFAGATPRLQCLIEHVNILGFFHVFSARRSPAAKVRFNFI